MNKQSDIILYHCGTSYASQKVRLYLAEKGISYQSHHIDLRKQEHITSNYRDINPQGTVPALKDKNSIICGSTDIMLYIENNYRIPSLLSNKKQIAKEQITFARCHEKLHDPHLRLLSYIYLFMDNKKKKDMDIDRVIELSEQHPWSERGEFLRRVLNNQISNSEIDCAKEHVLVALKEMDLLLNQSDGDFLFESSYSIADSVATATLFRVEKIGLLECIKDLATLNAYYNRMINRVSFTTACME